jgi:hypothetical protein
MKTARWLLIFKFFPLSCTQNKTATDLKVKIEAPELDRKMLLDRLNANSPSDHLKFAAAEQDFDYRIVLGTGQKPVGTTYGDINASGNSAAVFDAQGKEMFEFKGDGRWADSLATNVASREIIKRLLQVKRHSLR